MIMSTTTQTPVEARPITTQAQTTVCPTSHHGPGSWMTDTTAWRLLSEVHELLLYNVQGALSRHAPTLLALKQHAQSLAVLVSHQEPTIRSGRMLRLRRSGEGPDHEPRGAAAPTAEGTGTAPSFMPPGGSVVASRARGATSSISAEPSSLSSSSAWRHSGEGAKEHQHHHRIVESALSKDI